MSEEANGNKMPAGEPKRSADPLETGMLECPECHGSGAIAMLITSRPCTRCGGGGRIEPEARGPEPEDPAPEPETDGESYSYGVDPGSGVEVVSRTYDALGRLLSETIVGEEMKAFVLSDADPDMDDDSLDDESEGEAEE